MRPGQFIPLAEESELILKLGRTMLERACAEVSAWNGSRAHNRKLTVSVNVSAREMEDPRFVDRLGEMLAATTLPAEHLRIEVTESVVMQQAGVLNRIATELGVGLADNQEDRAIVDSVLPLGDKLGLTVIAGGMETAAQRNVLLELGERLGQGFHFAKPGPLPE